MGKPFRIRVERLRIRPNVSAGMDVLVLMSLAAMMRKTTEDPPPIRVSELNGGNWRVEDGRHRFFGAVIAGRPDVLAVEE